MTSNSSTDRASAAAKYYGLDALDCLLRMAQEPERAEFFAQQAVAFAREAAGYAREVLEATEDKPAQVGDFITVPAWNVTGCVISVEPSAFGSDEAIEARTHDGKVRKPK